VRVVAFAAFLALIMQGGIDAGNVIPVAGRHGKFRMTADAKLTASVDPQFLGIVGVVERCTMAVLTRDHGMMGTRNLFDLVVMALVAVLSALVLGRVIFPFLFVAQAVIAERIAAILCPEVGRHVDCPEQQNGNDHSNDHE